jgi:hypothetical protein
MNPETMIRKLLNCPELKGNNLLPDTKVLVDTAQERFGLKDEVLVVLRDSGDGDLFALFPEDPSNNLGTLCTCYSLVGQHSGADYYGCVDSSRPARGEDAQRLLDALKVAGYNNLKVIVRATAAMHRKRMKI